MMWFGISSALWPISMLVKAAFEKLSGSMVFSEKTASLFLCEQETAVYSVVVDIVSSVYDAYGKFSTTTKKADIKERC